VSSFLIDLRNFVPRSQKAYFDFIERSCVIHIQAESSVSLAAVIVNQYIPGQRSSKNLLNLSNFIKISNLSPTELIVNERPLPQ
jgi:hypothetical protein